MGEKTRILIVDDDVRFASGLSDIMEMKGFDVSVENRGEDAVARAGENSFDVILMDIKMPVMNGVEAFKKIKKISPGTTVIMMTAYAMEDLVRDSLKTGAYGILHKPFDIDKAVKMIEAAKESGAMIMIVDDDPGTRNSLKDVLEDKGYVVSLASDGEEAIKIATGRPLDLIFMDTKMPVLNGLETYLAIKDINPEIVTVLMTGYKSEMGSVVEQALRQGVYTCLYKPFDMKEVVDIISEISEKKGKM